MKQLSLWGDAVVEPKASRRLPVCSRCAAAVPPKPRSVMPLTHAVETVRGILIDRLDSALDDLTALAVEVVGDYIPDRGEAEKLAVRWVQAAQVRLFPEEFADGPAYTPDAAGRMDGVPVNPLGLVPSLPTVAIYAKHLLEVGQQSPAADLKTPDGKPLFTPKELERLGDRIERRTGR